MTAAVLDGAPLRVEAALAGSGVAARRMGPSCWRTDLATPRGRRPVSVRLEGPWLRIHSPWREAPSTPVDLLAANAGFEGPIRIAIGGPRRVPRLVADVAWGAAEPRPVERLREAWRDLGRPAEETATGPVPVLEDLVRELGLSFEKRAEGLVLALEIPGQLRQAVLAPAGPGGLAMRVSLGEVAEAAAFFLLAATDRFRGVRAAAEGGEARLEVGWPGAPAPEEIADAAAALSFACRRTGAEFLALRDARLAQTYLDPRRRSP